MIVQAGHNAKLLATPKKTKVSLCCSSTSVRKATVLCPLELERNGGGGQSLRQAFRIPARAQLIETHTDEKHMNFNAMHCSICGRQTEGSLEAA